MQITFNTEDSLEDLQNIHELVVNAIKKRGGNLVAEKVAPPQQVIEQTPLQKPNTEVFTKNPEPPTLSRLSNSPFASLLRSEQASSLGSPVHTVSKAPVVQQASTGTGEIARINDEYKRQYEQNRVSPNKPKGQNPEVDMSNIYMSDSGRREGRRTR